MYYCMYKYEGSKIMTEENRNNAYYNGHFESYTEQQIRAQIKKDKHEKSDSFKERLTDFLMVSTKEEAKELANKILPNNGSEDTFWVGDAKCFVIDNDDMFRITIVTDKEVLSYNFE